MRKITVFIFSLILLSCFLRMAAGNIFSNKAVKAYQLSGIEERVDDLNGVPLIKIVEPGPDTELTGTILIKGLATDNYGIVKLQIRIDEEEWVTLYEGERVKEKKFSLQYDTLKQTDGKLRITAAAYDKAGNKSKVSVTAAVDNDPLIMIISPLHNCNTNSRTLTIRGRAVPKTGNKLTKIIVALNNKWKEVPAKKTWTCDFTNLKQGTYQIKARCFSENTRSKIKEVSVKLDHTSPKISVTTPLDQQKFEKHDLLFQGMADDDFSGISKIQISTNTNTCWQSLNSSGEWKKQISLPYGTKKVFIRSMDKSCNVSRTTNITVTVLENDPEISILSPLQQGTGTYYIKDKNDELEISGTARMPVGNIDSVRMIIESQKDSTCITDSVSGDNNWSYDLKIKEYDTYLIQALAKGENGRTTITRPIRIKVCPLIYPLADKGDYYLYGGDIILSKNDDNHKILINSLLKEYEECAGGKVIPEKNESGQQNYSPSYSSGPQKGLAYKDWWVSARWPNGVVEYYYHRDSWFSDELKNTLRRAMDIIQEVCPGVVFKEKPHDIMSLNGLRIGIETDDRNGGSSTVGYTFYNYVGNESFWGGIVVLRNDYVKLDTFIHELCHALGMLHEHQRPDWKDYIDIKWDNIQADKKHNFYTPREAVQTYGNYDLLSIMHYPAYTSFNINPSKPVIVPLDKNYLNIIGLVTKLSDGDIATLKALYPDRAWGYWRAKRHPCLRTRRISKTVPYPYSFWRDKEHECWFQGSWQWTVLWYYDEWDWWNWRWVNKPCYGWKWVPRPNTINCGYWCEPHQQWITETRYTEISAEEIWIEQDAMNCGQKYEPHEEYVFYSGKW